jgi:hypothetical protein
MDDLFGEEETASPPGGPTRRRRGLRLLAIPLVIGLGVGFWFLSSHHHEQFYLQVDDGVVRVERGLFFPLGASEFRPTRAYAPLTLPAGVQPVRTGAMDAETLDRTLLQLFFDIADRELDDLDEGDVKLAEDVLLRAEKLDHTEVDDDRRVLALLGDVHFRQGLAEVRGLYGRFDETQKHFELAARQGGVHFKGAQRWVEAIDRLKHDFRQLSIDSGLNPDQVLARPPAPPTQGEAAPASEGEAAPPPSEAAPAEPSAPPSAAPDAAR